MDIKESWLEESEPTFSILTRACLRVAATSRPRKQLPGSPFTEKSPCLAPPGIALLLVGKPDARIPKPLTLCLLGVICSFMCLT